MPDELQITEEIHSTPSVDLFGHFRVDARDDGVLWLVGWALGVDDSVTQILVRSDGDVIASSDLNVERPDISEGFADRSDALLSGFEIAIEGQGSGESHLILEAELVSKSTAPMGEIRVQATGRKWTRMIGGG